MNLHLLPRQSILLLTLLVSLFASADVQFRVGDILYSGRSESRLADVVRYVGTAKTDLVAIPASVSNNGVQYSVVAIEAEAFQSVRGVKSVNIPATIEQIGANAFRNCMHLEAIEVAPENSRFSSEGGVLFNKNKTLLMAFPVQKASGASYTVPQSVTDIDDAAFYYSHLTAVTLPQKLRSIGSQAFYGNNTLADVNFPATLTAIGDEAFIMCKSLTKLELPDNLETISSDAFRFCSAVTTVKLPAKLRRIGSGAFASCEALQQIDFPTTLDSLTPGAFAECKTLTQVSIPASSSKFLTAEGILFNKARTALLLYPAGHTDSLYTVSQGITLIGASAFSTNRNLKYVSLPQSLRVIGDEAFRFCASLARMDVPDAVATIGNGAFQECISLEQMHLPASLTEIADNLLNTTILTRIDIPKQVRRIGKNAFSLTPISHLNLPDSVEEIGDFAFFDNSFLRTANLGAGVKRIGEGAFGQCTLLKRVEFGPELREIGSRAFYACWTLSEINLPAGVRGIGNEAFGGCLHLSKAILPPRLTVVPHYCFYGANALRDLFMLPPTPPATGTEAFTAEPAAVRLYVPQDSQEQYSQGFWNNFVIRKGISYQYLDYGENELMLEPESLALLVAPRARTMAPVLSSRWMSENPTVAFADSLGLVHALDKGTAVIWYVAQDSTMTEHRISCNVTVKDAGVGIAATDTAPMPGDAIFTLTGTKAADLFKEPEAAATLPPGIYIVRRRGVSEKLVIKGTQK